MTERMEWAQARLAEWLNDYDQRSFYNAIDELGRAIWDLTQCPQHQPANGGHICCVEGGHVALDGDGRLECRADDDPCVCPAYLYDGDAYVRSINSLASEIEDMATAFRRAS